ncbi:hypothetical protein [Pseudoxanthomonas japonensis]|uniref:hypothetical protein n=1 Tax=Pseudoxanthomonas japonensis TaxID=69284 RepID=UPI000DB7269D|nr:hypothetical protein [Pseudoxanthomonas japonensis]PZQ32790.1 MAG: hypothetical protein DI562_02810 [Stenotrophomonas acidaminiphila]
MNPDEIDRLLASDVSVTPTPGFLTSVMRAVERERAALPPLAFPWKRALPGGVALAAALVGGAVSVANDTAGMQRLDEWLAQVSAPVASTQLHWVALALLVTAVSLVGASCVSARAPDFPRKDTPL